MLESALYAIRPVSALLAFITLVYLVFFGPFCSLFYTRLIQKHYRPSRKMLVVYDILVTLLNLTVVITITMMILRWLFGSEIVSLAPTPTLATGAAQFAIYFFAFDLYYYSVHRLLHKQPLNQYIHSLHHRSTRPTPFTSYAVHPVEGLMSFMFILALFLVMDISLTVFTAMNAYSVVHAVVLHSGHDFFPRWWYRSPLTRWYVTPTFHDLHHSEPSGVNLGIYTTIWDRLFGTISPNLEEASSE